MKGYILYNDEQGWISKCPVFVDKEKAELEAADKCRHYSVIELDSIADCEPCHPLKKYPKCDDCCRFVGAKRYVHMAKFILLHHWADGQIIIINKTHINSVCRHFDGKRTTIILSKDVVYVNESVEEIYKLITKFF